MSIEVSERLSRLKDCSRRAPEHVRRIIERELSSVEALLRAAAKAVDEGDGDAARWLSLLAEVKMDSIDLIASQERRGRAGC